jgi:spermidine synthase
VRWKNRDLERGVAAVAFLVSLALLDAQVAVTRLLAYRFFYHFVFFVISLAQLGLAAAGAWVYAAGRAAGLEQHLVRWLLGLAALPLVILGCYSWLAPLPTLSFAKLDGPPAYAYLTAIALLLVALNLCGGMVLTLLFTTFKERIGVLYASDLTGAALGCLASVALMRLGGPVRAFLLSGLAAAGAVALVARAPAERAAAGALALLLGIGMTAPDLFHPYATHPSIRGAFLRSEWTDVARTEAVTPGRYVIDGDASTDVREDGPAPPTPEYELIREKPEVAIIGVGAGPQLRAALGRGASRVMANDINATILRWATEDDRSFNHGLFHHPAIEVALGEGRHVLRSSRREFDLIVMHAIDTWTASSQGAYSLTENFLYTSEAMRDFLSRLREGGVVSIRRWLFWPPRENLRLFTTVHDALSRAGFQHPENHIVVVSPRREFRRPNLKVWGFLFFSNAPFTEERLEPLDRYVETRHFSYLYRPGKSLDTPFQEFVDAESKEAFYAGYPYLVAPASDRNPFFFQLVRPWSWGPQGEPASSMPYGRSATLLVLCLSLAVVLTVLLLGTPLFLRRADVAGDRQLFASLVYFGSLGLGFMAFELPTIQVMTLFLGHPTYALSVVLLGLLAWAGAGSALIGRLPAPAGGAALAAVVLLAVASAIGLLPAVHALIHLPDWGRFLTAFSYLMVVGIPLGMPFVAGVRLLDPARPHLVAWAWAVNGATAVVGSCLLMFLMVYRGSDAAFLVAAGCYAVAALARLSLARRR